MTRVTQEMTCLNDLPTYYPRLGDMYVRYVYSEHSRDEIRPTVYMVTRLRTIGADDVGAPDTVIITCHVCRPGTADMISVRTHWTKDVTRWADDTFLLARSPLAHL